MTKFETAKRLIKVTSKVNRHNKDKKVYIKCCILYIWQCLIKGNDKFELFLKGKHVQSFIKRIEDWIIYFRYRDEILKPVDIMVTNAPDEIKLEMFLNHCGLKIVDEELDTLTSRYIIGKK